MPFAEPPPELVERAIVKLLEIAQLQGITPVDFIQMLDSGMRISDFLHAVDVAASGYTIGDTVNYIEKLSILANAKLRDNQRGGSVPV